MMENTMEKLLAVIKAKSQSFYHLYRYAELDGDEYHARYYLGAWLELDNVLAMARDPEFLDQIAQIYEVGGESDGNRIPA